MKKMMNLSAITFVLIAFLGISTVNAQEWTKDQNEVWKVVENMWTNWQAKNYDAAFANVHENYLGWNDEMPLPTSKAKWLGEMKMYSANMSKENFSIERARIVVEDDAAVVDYYFSFSFLYTEGDTKKMVSYKGKNAEFYTNVKGKWMLLGDFSYGEPDK
jgi:hypothetical protein